MINYVILQSWILLVLLCLAYHLSSAHCFESFRSDTDHDGPERIRQREFGEVFFECFLHRAHYLLLSVFGRKRADGGHSQRMRPEG